MEVNSSTATKFIVAGFASSFVFAAMILIVGIYGGAKLFAYLDWVTFGRVFGKFAKDSWEAGVRADAWMQSVNYAYIAIQTLVLLLQRPGNYIGRGVDNALAALPLIAMVVVITLFWTNQITLGVLEKKFFWGACWAVLIDLAYGPIAYRMATRQLGVN
jgi:hypothetical protein